MPRRKKDTSETPLPKVSVLERRLAHPFGSPSVPITLKEGGPWQIRVVNANMRSGRIGDMIHNKGWTFVQASDIDGTPEELGFRKQDDRLVLGEHGEEVLMKMPLDMFNRIQQAKAEHNQAALGTKQTKELVANRTAAQFGSEAADTVHQKFDDAISIRDERGAVVLDEDETAPPTGPQVA